MADSVQLSYAWRFSSVGGINQNTWKNHKKQCSLVVGDRVACTFEAVPTVPKHLGQNKSKMRTEYSPVQNESVMGNCRNEDLRQLETMTQDSYQMRIQTTRIRQMKTLRIWTSGQSVDWFHSALYAWLKRKRKKGITKTVLDGHHKKDMRLREDNWTEIKHFGKLSIIYLHSSGQINWRWWRYKPGSCKLMVPSNAASRTSLHNKWMKI